MDFMVRDDKKTTKHYLEEELYNNGNLKIERWERLKLLGEMGEMYRSKKARGIGDESKNRIL